jgi:protease IV
MKGLLKLLGATVALFFVVLFATGTVAFVRKAWFGGFNRAHHISVLEISGVLTQSRPKIKELEKILDNPGTKAIVVRVNSPGGLVAPSQELYSALKRANEKVPVIVSMGPLAASGGYYLALGGRKILANPGTLTASIGVIIEFINAQKLLQWAKIDRFAITGGKFKAIGTPTRPMTPEERALLTEMVENIHSQFKTAVKERRQLTDEEMVNATDGRVMTGEQALKAKLVDQLGDLHDAVELAREVAALPKETPVDYNEPKPGLLMKILMGDDADSAEEALQGFSEWRAQASLSPGWRVLLLSPFR